MNLYKGGLPLKPLSEVNYVFLGVYITPKKIKLIKKRKTFLTVIKKEGASSPV